MIGNYNVRIDKMETDLNLTKIMRENLQLLQMQMEQTTVGPKYAEETAAYSYGQGGGWRGRGESFSLRVWLCEAGGSQVPVEGAAAESAPDLALPGHTAQNPGPASTVQ